MGCHISNKRYYFSLRVANLLHISCASAVACIVTFIVAFVERMKAVLCLNMVFMSLFVAHAKHEAERLKILFSNLFGHNVEWRIIDFFRVSSRVVLRTLEKPTHIIETPDMRVIRCGAAYFGPLDIHVRKSKIHNNPFVMTLEMFVCEGKSEFRRLNKAGNQRFFFCFWIHEDIGIL